MDKKQYLVFAYSESIPNGGVRDFLGCFDDDWDAREAALSNMDHDLVDIVTLDEDGTLSWQKYTISWDESWDGENESVWRTLEAGEGPTILGVNNE